MKSIIINIYVIYLTLFHNIFLLLNRMFGDFPFWLQFLLELCSSLLLKYIIWYINVSNTLTVFSPFLFLEFFIELYISICSPLCFFPPPLSPPPRFFYLFILSSLQYLCYFLHRNYVVYVCSLYYFLFYLLYFLSYIFYYIMIFKSKL